MPGLDNKKKLNKIAVFDILSGKDSAIVLAARYGVTRSTIGQARRGETYKKFYEEYKNSNFYERASLAECVPKDHSGCYFYSEGDVLKMSFADLMVSINLNKKTLVSIDFNTEIRGHRLDYLTALHLLKDYGFLV